MRTLAVLLLLGCAGCRSGPDESDVIEWYRSALGGDTQEPAPSALFRHTGPAVAPGGSGPARFALLLHEYYDAPRALQFAGFVDRWWREPGNEGYEAVLAALEVELRALRFGEEPGRELRVIESELGEPAWTPLGGRLVLHSRAGERVLHAFDAPEDRDRLMIPAGAPSADVTGPIALALEDVHPGSVLVVEEGHSRQLVRSARGRGAVALLSASLEGYNRDTSGAERHLDAIQYTHSAAGGDFPVGQISPRALQLVREAARADPEARLAFQARVRTEKRPLRTLVATLVGRERPGEAIALAAHVQEPGASDNASGVATQLEGVRALVAGLDSGRIEPPARSLCFVWGLEMRQSSVLLEQGERRVVAGVVADMTGESRAATGAWPLLERPPDPGSWRPLAPDAHTEWGGRAVQPADADASAIALVARVAMHDAALAAGGWETREHPFEGGSDHQVFLRKSIPAVLFWHFTDFTYHTSLDRLEMLDADEMRRMGTAIFATAMALADPRPADLARYLDTLKLESALRRSAAREAQDAELEQRWADWLRLERQWLRVLCLGERAGELPTPAPKQD